MEGKGKMGVRDGEYTFPKQQTMADDWNFVNRVDDVATVRNSFDTIVKVPNVSSAEISRRKEVINQYKE